MRLKMNTAIQLHARNAVQSTENRERTVYAKRNLNVSLLARRKRNEQQEFDPATASREPQNVHYALSCVYCSLAHTSREPLSKRIILRRPRLIQWKVVNDLASTCNTLRVGDRFVKKWIFFHCAINNVHNAAARTTILNYYKKCTSPSTSTKTSTVWLTQLLIF
jgi:hypothetical protein